VSLHANKFFAEKRSIIGPRFPSSRGILPKKFHNARGNKKEISGICADAEISARCAAEISRRRRGRFGKV
jgi:hypothetical protein